jgi:hypothetical protein
MADAGWLLIGLTLGVLLSIALIEWHAHFSRRMARHHTRSEDRAR